MEKQIITGEPERRFLQVTAELRAASEEGKESRTIHIKSAVFNTETKIGNWFREKIDPAFFDDVLSDSTSETVALFNHNSDKILGRRTAKTLKLWKEEDALHGEFESPNTTAGNDLLESVKRGDISGCSFCFRVAEEQWIFDENNPSNDLRILKKCEELIDVGPVTFPAYKETSVEVKRSRPESNEKRSCWKQKARERQLALMSKS
jgi:HK97 family phage prohead protease